MAIPDNPESGPRRTRGRPRGWDDKTAQNTIKSLDRAMAVFDHVSRGSGLALSTIAAETQESPATIYRILVTLAGRGLVEFDAEAQLWHIGPHAFTIGTRFLRRTSLVDRARPVLRRLMEATGETANLGVEREGAILFVSQVETHASIRAFFPPGTLSPMHVSGIGKALLAAMPQDRLERLLAGQDFASFTEHTITDRDRLADELRRIRARGYAVDDEERNLGMRCIAAPVFDMNAEAVAGVSLSGPTSRVTPDAVVGLSGEVIAAAEALTRAIGGVARREV
ncbi:IclR family transcriptional regulator, acetate operon repressor [Paracoccus isoporae]|uniref:IclR family transcriptional regulator, acetate operon repressor n=1 Tax=Paracoccus isoporae TaxID=591205 RepID=A0A1G7FB02_9RHOB|nr:HTH-type transcriptional regulator BhcR [Paracoccus isoporae]SDE73109.1 IclR family transcriptional regulator, acetate operon repressor [Paracoccus isoporae]